jgi:hypothetical protein
LNSTGAASTRVSLTIFCLGGCATTIYKSSAVDYVEAAKQITTALENAELSRSNAESQGKLGLIVEDRNCHVGRPSGVYLRPQALGDSAVRVVILAGWLREQA